MLPINQYHQAKHLKGNFDKNNVLDCNVLIGGVSISPTKSNLLKIPQVLPLKKWGPEYEISVDIKINSWINNYGSIFRFTSKDGDYGSFGNRSPGLWTKQGTSDTLYVNTDINSKAHADYSIDKIETGKWFNLQISQKNISVRIE